jgi:hypothetical protein
MSGLMFWTDVLEGPVTNSTLAQWWAITAGFVLVAVGVLGFIPNPIVGGANSLATTDALHNIVHIGTGVLALFVYMRTTGDAKANALIGFGLLYAAIFVLVLASPTLFGLFAVPANATLHVIHFALAAVSIGVGVMARGSYEPMRAQ